MFGLIALIASPALAQQKPGVIQVNSGSATGEIVLDGFPTGIMAPGKLESVPPGEHQIEVEYGCMLASGTVVVESEETVDANLKVENRGGTGTIRVKSLPRGAEVLIDSAPVANIAEGVEAKCGARKLTVESPGFEPYEELVVVSTGKWSTVEPTLVEAAMVDEPIERRDTYDDFDEEPYDDYRDDDLDDLDALEGPDEYEAEMRRREDAARREAEQRAREEARRKAEEEARRAEQERMDRFGDIDSLDEPDEPIEEGRRGRKDKDDDDDRDAFDELDDLGDDPDFDEPDDYDDYDEPDYYDDGFEDPDAMDDFRDYDDLDGGDDERSSRPPRDKKPAKDRKPVPVRGLATAGGGVVGVTGIVVAATGSSTMKEKQAEYTRVVDATNTTSPAALQLASDVDAAKGQRNVGIGLAVVGLGAGAASFALIPPAWNTSLVVAPTQDGGGMAMVTVEF